jgi:hypothetical protein
MKAPEPHFQGRLDVFCAIYAVINALVLTHKMPAGKSRKLFHESILHMAHDLDTFNEQLEQNVEYHDLVDWMLNREVLRYDILIRTPFSLETLAPKEDVWGTLTRWLAKPGRAAVLRFVRPLDMPGNLEIRHWSTAQAVRDDRISLFDSSLEKHALREIVHASCLTGPAGLRPGLVYLDPSSIRLIGNPDTG